MDNLTIVIFGMIVLISLLLAGEVLAKMKGWE
jgi:hypothetical protein